jgi:hypothetical protein
VSDFLLALADDWNREPPSVCDGSEPAAEDERHGRDEEGE